MPTVEKEQQKFKEWINPVFWEVYLHNPEAAIEAGGEAPEPRLGYVPDLHYQLEDIYKKISSQYSSVPVDSKDRGIFQGETEAFKARTVVITFNRDKHEKHIKGVRFNSPIKRDLENFLDELQNSLS